MLYLGGSSGSLMFYPVFERALDIHLVYMSYFLFVFLLFFIFFLFTGEGIWMVSNTYRLATYVIFVDLKIN